MLLNEKKDNNNLFDDFDEEVLEQLYNEEQNERNS